MPKITDYISKSDFKVARDCATKLYYKKLKYHSMLEEDEYMSFLADGGYAVGKLATLLKPGGIEVGREHGFDRAVAETAELLKKENVTIYEAGIYSGHKLAFIDILEKKGNVLNLIEVKSKSFDSSAINPWKGMDEYLEDVAFQTMVLKELYPKAEVHSFLYLPDKAKRTNIEGLAGWFRVTRPGPEENDGQRGKVEVEFLNERDSHCLEQLRTDGIMHLLNVDREIAVLRKLVEDEAARFVCSVRNGLKKIATPLTGKCFKCEYRAGEKGGCDGYRECWGALADVSPHISELYYAGSVGGSEPVVDRLIAQGRVGLFDVPVEALKKKDGGMGPRGLRQKVQIENTKTGFEWFSQEMKEELDSWEYPLWFIDFETSINALPFHKGMRPYELVAFQWSCHRVDSPGAKPVHAEWINMEQGFPNFKFAESLMANVGDKGTPLMWATHENTVLSKVLEQMDKIGHKNDRLRDWLLRMTSESKGGKKVREGRLVDMNAFTLRHYFHPDMKGKTSLKKVLPAIWRNNPYLHEIEWFREYVKYDNGGMTLDPYDTLGGDILELGDEEMPTTVVRDGTGAMRAYFDMTFGECANDPPARDSWKTKLLKYCKLDTMSMVIAWTHWMEIGYNIFQRR